MRKPLLIDTNHYGIHSYFMSKASSKTRYGERVKEMKRKLQRIDPETQPEEFEKALERIQDPSIKDDCIIDGFRATFHIRLIDHVVANGFDGVIFARDPDTASWRKDIYPDYKGKRDKVALFDGEAQANRFFETLDNEVATLSKLIPSIWCPRFRFVEADDTIATYTKWASKHRPAMHIEIMSRDRDYLQLYKHGNVHMYDPQDRKVLECNDPEYALQTKILCGDTSDNIKSVRRGFAEVKAMAFYKQGKLDEFLSVGDARKRYNLNRQLIDMDLIPTHITDPIMEDLDKRAATDHFSIPDIRGLHNYYIKNGLFSPADMKFQRWYDILKSPKFGVFAGN